MERAGEAAVRLPRGSGRWCGRGWPLRRGVGPSGRRMGTFKKQVRPFGQSLTLRVAAVVVPGELRWSMKPMVPSLEWRRQSEEASTELLGLGSFAS